MALITLAIPGTY